MLLEIIVVLVLLTINCNLTGQQEVNLVVKKLRAAFPLSTYKKQQRDIEQHDEVGLEENLTAAIRRVKKTRKKQTSAPLPAINLDE